MTLIVSQTTVSASESDWDLVTQTDDLTKKTSDPFMLYEVAIPGTSNGKLELQVICSSAGNDLLGMSFPEVHNNKNTNLKPDDKSREIIYAITVFDSPLILVDSKGISFARQLNIDGKTIENIIYIKNPSFNNVHYANKFSISTDSDYSNLPRRQEIVFAGGKKVIIDFGQQYLNYVKACFVGRNCQRVGDRYSVCGS